jgi:outer membrane protein TolC
MSLLFYMMRTPRICLIVIILFSEQFAMSQTHDNKSDSNLACATLGELVSEATNISADLKAQNAEARIAWEQYEAAKASVKPTLKATAAVVKQDQSKSKVNGSDEAFPTTAKLTLSQPLFAGGAEYAALRRAEQKARQGVKQQDGARIKVARDVISKVFQVLMAQAELKSTSELRELSRRRLKNIQGRVAIGRSKSADGLGAEVQVANADAQYEVARLGLDSAVRQLQSVTGKNGQTVCEPVGKPPLAIKTWDELRSRVHQRPDIQAADLGVTIADENIAIARAGHFPVLDLGGNYYVKRPESQKASGNWDVTLSASLPLYSGGLVSAKVNEAVAGVQKQRALTEQLKRLAEDEARELWEVVTTGLLQLNSLEDAAKKSTQYYQIMASDERKGLASSLETLQVLNASIDAQRAAQKSKYKYGESVRQLHLVLGDLEGASR